MNFSKADLDLAAEYIYRYLVPTPQISWPLLNKRCACDVWVKHENHLPTGAFKVRGGIWYLHNLLKGHDQPAGVIAATRGNHGQSVAFAARMNGINAKIVVPEGNSPDKNLAMQAYGAELIIHGKDFNDALDYARGLAEQEGIHLFPSFHPHLIQGVCSYGIELLQSVPDLDTVYVPVGMGSGISGMITARNILKLKTKIVGVVAENAPAYFNSFNLKKPVASDSANTMADGLAVRIPDKTALDYMLENVERIITVSEQEILDAIRYIFTDTHNVAEGAGASTLAALLKDRDSAKGKIVGIILSGGNINQKLFIKALHNE